MAWRGHGRCGLLVLTHVLWCRRVTPLTQGTLPEVSEYKPWNGGTGRPCARTSCLGISRHEQVLSVGTDRPRTVRVVSPEEQTQQQTRCLGCRRGPGVPRCVTGARPWFSVSCAFLLGPRSRP